MHKTVALDTLQCSCPSMQNQPFLVCAAGGVGAVGQFGQGVVCAAAHKLVPQGQGAVQGAHLCPPGAGPAQSLLAGPGQGRLRPSHQPQALEGLPSHLFPHCLLRQLCLALAWSWQTDRISVIAEAVHVAYA